MKTVITEKPSVAIEIARLLGATEKKEGYYIGNGYQVTWAYGHLIGLAMPEDYGVKGFDRFNLPILPDPFTLTVRKIKKHKTYVTDSGALKQLTVIEKLFKNCTSIIVATDAGREGELIFRYIYQYLKCDKPFERLWISSLTEKTIRQGFDNLKSGSDFDGLYNAAKGRSRADWLVGINASQALSIAVGNGVYSLGRVQTPTLALICKRYKENIKFIPQIYWQIQLAHKKGYIDFKSISSIKWDDKKTAENIMRSIQREGKANVVLVETKNITEQPPLLFDLTGLQKEANKKFSFSADETLAIAQILYEKRFITYPRTGSKFIPEDMWPEIPNLIRALQFSETFKDAISQLKWGRFNKRIVNDLRVTDHHGILITDRIPSALQPKEKAIYEMIAFRLLEAISENCIKEVTDISIQALHYDFSIRGCEIIELGWRSINRNLASTDSDPIQELPHITIGESLTIKENLVIEKQTKPPALYTEASLLAAMETAGKHIENEDERKAIHNIGIGTPATRAAIIETLFTRNYIKRQNKSLIPTEKGIQVYEIVKDKKIADVEMTASWELALQKIENKETDPQKFKKEMETYAETITKELLSATINDEKHQAISCPKCKTQTLVVRDILVKCPDEKCNWVQFRNICGVHLSISEVSNLILKGSTSLLKNMKSRAGKKFDAYIILNDKAESIFEFDKKTKNK